MGQAEVLEVLKCGEWLSTDEILARLEYPINRSTLNVNLLRLYKQGEVFRIEVHYPIAKNNLPYYRYKLKS
jgi:hypothetical protein